jgi:hypothetical protein
MACAGNSSEICGGALRLSLYEMVQGSSGSSGSGTGSDSSTVGRLPPLGFVLWFAGVALLLPFSGWLLLL